MSVSRIWQRIALCMRVRATAPREETARLCAEIDRLRAENRALLNSILGIAGVPPIPADFPTSRSESPLSPASRPGFEALPSRPGTSLRSGSEGRAVRARPGANGGQALAPMRRRSWQQINRMLEFESGKKAAGGREE